MRGTTVGVLPFTGTRKQTIGARRVARDAFALCRRCRELAARGSHVLFGFAGSLPRRSGTLWVFGAAHPFGERVAQVRAAFGASLLARREKERAGSAFVLRHTMPEGVGGAEVQAAEHDPPGASSFVELRGAGVVLRHLDAMLVGVAELHARKQIAAIAPSAHRHRTMLGEREHLYVGLRGRRGADRCGTRRARARSTTNQQQ